MILTKVQKARKLDSIRSHMKNFNSVICVQYENFINSEIERMRDSFFGSGNKIVCGKNSLISRALSNENIDATKMNLKSATLLIFSNDIFNSLRSLKSFTKVLKNYPKIKLEVSCGILEGSLAETSLMKKLVEIQSKDAIRVELVTIVNSPLQNLIKILNNPLVDLCKILDYRSKNC